MPNVNSNATPKCLIASCSGQTDLRIKGYCESHYLQQYFEPIAKERRNLEEAIAHLYARELEVLQPLGEAKKEWKILTDGKAKIYLCNRRCGFKTNSAMALAWHEPDCDYRGPELKSEKSRRNAAKPKVAKIIEDEEAIFG